MKLSALVVLLFSFLIAHSQSKGLTTVIQKGHGAVVKTVAYSPNGEFIVTGSRDKTAKLWSVATGLEIRTFFGHESTINDAQFSQDGKRIITSSADNTAKIWDVENGKEIWSSPTFDSYVTSVAFDPAGKRAAIGGYDNKAYIFDLNTNDTIKVFKVNSDRGLGYGIDLSFSSDGNWFAIGEDNRTVTVYNTKSWDLIYTLKPEEGWCGGCGSYLEFSPNSQFIAKLSNRGSLEEYNLSDGSLKKTYKTEVKELSGLSYNQDGTKILASDEDSIWVYSTSTGELESEFKAEVKEINDAIFSPDGKTILIGGNDNKASQWNIRSGLKTAEFSGLINHRDKGGLNYDPDNYWESYISKYIKYENNVLLTKDGQFFVKGKTGKKAKLIEVKTGNVKMEYIGHEKAVLCFDFSSDETLLITGGGDGQAILWEKKTGKKIKVIKAHHHPIFDIHFSHDQSKIVTASWDGLVKIWDVKTGEQTSKIYFEKTSANRVTFSQNDLYLLISKRDQTFTMFEIDSKKIVREFIGHTKSITHLDQDFNKNQFLSTNLDGSIALWDYSTGLLKKKLRHPKGGVMTAIFMGEQIVSAGTDRIIRVWNINTGELSYELNGHQAEITSLNLSEDKKLLVSGDLDGVIKFWDLDKKEEFFEYIQIADNDFMVKTPDGYFYATEGAQNTIHFVDKLKVYEANQFFNEFYRPDLIQNAFEKKNSTRSKSMHGMLLESPPPTLKISSLRSQDQMSAELFITITDNGGSIKDLQLFHNGKSIPIEKKSLTVEKDLIKYHYKSPLVAGHNLFTAKATSKGNIESMPAKVDIISNNKTPGGKCYVLTIGVNTYKNSKMNLNYAQADAQAFADSIQSNTKTIYQEIITHSLYNEEATKENILNKFNELSEIITMNDVFILYYAGHGSVVDDNFYFIPTETVRLYDVTSLKKTAIDASELQQELRKIKALKQIVIMDACQSGQSVELLAQRGATEEKAIAQLSRSAGIHVLASAGSEQYASEFQSLGHGLFTYVLLEGLSGKADGSTLDGKITIYELKSYLDDQVPELSLEHKGKPQYPFTFSRGHDFPLVIYRH